MKIRNFLFLFLLTLPGFSQNLLEIPVADHGSQVRAINLNQNGVLVLEKTVKDQLNIFKVDTQMQVNWTSQVNLPDKSVYLDDLYDGNFVHLIMERGTGKDLLVLKISTSFPAYRMFDISFNSNFRYGFYTANDHMICVGGHLKDQPVISLLNTATGVPVYISENLKGVTELNDLKLTEHSLEAVFLNYHKKTGSLLIKSYDFEGKSKNFKSIPSPDEQFFISTRFFTVHDEIRVVGNYGLGKIPYNSFFPAQGIFIADIKDEKIDYLSFDRFNNLFEFLGERQKTRLEKQVKKRKEKGSEYNFSYRFLISDIISNEAGSMIVGEIFEPEYRSRNYSGIYGYPSLSNMYWGRPLYYQDYLLNRTFSRTGTRGYEIFDGFKYLEGIVFQIGEEGNILWDHSFPYKNLKYYELVPHLKMGTANDKTFVLFSNLSKLNVNVIDRLGRKDESFEYDQASLNLNIKEKRAEFTNFEHWYENVYYNWGVRKVSGSGQCFIEKIMP